MLLSVIVCKQLKLQVTIFNINNLEHSYMVSRLGFIWFLSLMAYQPLWVI